MTRRRSATTVLTLLALAGCGVQDNERLTLGVDTAVAEFQRDPAPRVSSGPSITGLDRSHWARTEYVVPVHGVAHTTTYAPPVFELDNHARQRGEFPSAADALDLGEGDGGEATEQAMRSHAFAVLDMVLIVPRMLYKPLSTTGWSPRWSYERAPESVRANPADAEPGE